MLGPPGVDSPAPTRLSGNARNVCDGTDAERVVVRERGVNNAAVLVEDGASDVGLTGLAPPTGDASACGCRYLAGKGVAPPSAREQYG